MTMFVQTRNKALNNNTALCVVKMPKLSVDGCPSARSLINFSVAVDMLKTWKLVGPCTASAHGMWSCAHWKQWSTGSDGGDGGCSKDLASHHFDWSLNRPPCGKRKSCDLPNHLHLNPSAHVSFCVWFFRVAHVSFAR